MYYNHPSASVAPSFTAPSSSGYRYASSSRPAAAAASSASVVSPQQQHQQPKGLVVERPTARMRNPHYVPPVPTDLDHSSLNPQPIKPSVFREQLIYVSRDPTIGNGDGVAVIANGIVNAATHAAGLSPMGRIYDGDRGASFVQRSMMMEEGGEGVGSIARSSVARSSVGRIYDEGSAMMMMSGGEEPFGQTVLSSGDASPSLNNTMRSHFGGGDGERSVGHLPNGSLYEIEPAHRPYASGSRTRRYEGGGGAPDGGDRGGVPAPTIRTSQASFSPKAHSQREFNRFSQPHLSAGGGGMKKYSATFAASDASGVFNAGGYIPQKFSTQPKNVLKAMEEARAREEALREHQRQQAAEREAAAFYARNSSSSSSSSSPRHGDDLQQPYSLQRSASRGGGRTSSVVAQQQRTLSSSKGNVAGGATSRTASRGGEGLAIAAEASRNDAASRMSFHTCVSEGVGVGGQGGSAPGSPSPSSRRQSRGASPAQHLQQRASPSPSSSPSDPRAEELLRVIAKYEARNKLMAEERREHERLTAALLQKRGAERDDGGDAAASGLVSPVTVATTAAGVEGSGGALARGQHQQIAAAHVVATAVIGGGSGVYGSGLSFVSPITSRTNSNNGDRGVAAAVSAAAQHQRQAQVANQQQQQQMEEMQRQLRIMEKKMELLAKENAELRGEGQ